MSSAPRTPDDGPLIFISAAEPSADLYGAALIRAVRRVCPTARFVGVAGSAMQAEGCWAIRDMCRQSAMLTAAVRAAGRAWWMLASATRHLAAYPFDAAVVIDSPTLHLPLAKKAKRLGIPVLYYIAPQVWAWGEFRTSRIRRRVERLAVIFPFEEDFFRSRGVRADFVGHPLFEALMQRSCDRSLAERFRAAGSPIVAILPGSRTHVVREVFPGQLQVARRIRDRFPAARFLVSVASPTVDRVITPLLEASGVPADRIAGHNAEILTAADLALVTSGTATLEVAYSRTPMIVMYNGSKLGYWLIGRWLLRTRRLSLVNILAGREIVPEFMPYYTSTAPIAQRALELLESPSRRAQMSEALGELVRPLTKPGAADNTAAILLELIRTTRQARAVRPPG